MSLFQYTNPSFRELQLEDCNHPFDEDESMALSRSSLGNQCEVLSIQVINRQCIIILIKNMIKLHALDIQCKDDEYCEVFIINR